MDQSVSKTVDAVSFSPLTEAPDHPSGTLFRLAFGHEI
jgi:hypothetical protein